jgi:hypothetical protein
MVMVICGHSVVVTNRWLQGREWVIACGHDRWQAECGGRVPSKPQWWHCCGPVANVGPASVQNEMTKKNQKKKSIFMFCIEGGGLGSKGEHG